MVPYRWLTQTDVHGEPLEMSAVEELEDFLLAQFRIECQ